MWREEKDIPTHYTPGRTSDTQGNQQGTAPLFPTKKDKIALFILFVIIPFMLFSWIASSYDERFKTLGVILFGLVFAIVLGLGIRNMFILSTPRNCPTCHIRLRLPRWYEFGEESIKLRCDSCGYFEDTGMSPSEPEDSW